MRVLVTGGTGFVGSHAVAALVRVGHDVRLLVRSRDRVAPALDPHGVKPDDVHAGDVTHTPSVEAALEGCEAVVHAASVFSFDPRRRREFQQANVRGAEIVLGAAARAGLRPILHISSFAALLPARKRPLTPDTKPGQNGPPYARTKAEQERIARRLQEEGAPIVIVQPGAVFGPNDPHFGESDQLVRAILARKMPIVPAGGLPIVDVRDLAACLARAVEGDAPRRYLVGGTYISFRELVALLSQLTDRRLPAIPLPERVILPLAYAAEGAQLLVKSRLTLASEPPWLTRQRAHTDDSRAHVELGFAPRDPHETLSDNVRSLLATGRISSREAGALAPQTASVQA